MGHCAVFAQEVQPTGFALSAIAQDGKARLLKVALEGVQLQLELRAFVNVAQPVDADVPFGFYRVCGLEVFQPFGTPKIVSGKPISLLKLFSLLRT